MISILYVDDEPELLELAQIFLEQAGEFRVRTATSAEEILADPGILAFDAIISDYQMPVMDGITFLKEIRKKAPELPFLLFTGRGREEIVIEALNNGADFYIQKGGDPKAQFAELANKIRYAVNRKRAERELQKKSDELNASYEQIAANEEELRQQLDELTAKQEALQESEERFRAFTENVPDLTTIADITGRYTYISPSIQRITGRSVEEMLGKNYRDSNAVFGVLPEDAEILVKCGKVAINNPKKPQPVPPFRVRTASGSIVFLEGSLTFLPVVKGIQGLLFHGRDITDRRHTENLLAEREENYRSLVELAPIAVSVHRDGKILYVNPEAVRLVKATQPEDLIGKDIFSFLHPDEYARAAEHFRQLYEDGKAVTLQEERLLTVDGTPFTVEVAATRIRYDGLPSVLVVFRDVTEGKRAERVLAESEERFRALVETTSDTIWEFSEEGLYTYISPNVQEILGYSPEELIGKPPFVVMPPVEAERASSEFRHCLEARLPFTELETINLHKDGSTVILATSGVPFFSADGRFAGYRGIGRNITTRKKTEEALRESEEKYRTLVENASEVIAIVQDWKIVFVNRQGAALLGKTTTELAGQPFMDFIWPDDRERLKSLHGTRVTGEPAVENYDFRIIGAGEKPVWVSNSIAAISWKGKPATLSLMTNITDRKFAEAALLESEETFRNVIEGAPEAIYIGAEWNFQYLNPAALRLFGASSGEQLIGTPFMDRIHPKFHKAIRDRVLGLYDDRMAAPPLEEVYLKLDGSEAEVEVSSVPFRYKGKDGALVFIWDITDRKKAEQARRESAAEYRRILDTMQDAYIRSDAEGKIIMVNPSAARMFTYASPREMLGIPVASLYSNPAKRQEIVTRLEKDEMVTDVVEMMLRMDSTTFWASINVQAIRGEDERLIGTEGIIRDVTERKALEQAIQDTNKKLSLLNSITRHDVANQLTALRGYAQLAELSNPDPVILDFLQKIETATDTIAGQIEFTKAYQELGEKTPAWFRIDTLIEKTARTEVSFSNTCRAIEVFSDPMIERVFYNLFDNAIRHGDHVTTIGVRCERAPDGLVIYVEDDGVGVVPEEKEKIFEKGFGKHTGFGLFLAREILATTGITIRETGYVGVGARFEITVPREMWRIFPGG